MLNPPVSVDIPRIPNTEIQHFVKEDRSERENTFYVEESMKKCNNQVEGVLQGTEVGGAVICPEGKDEDTTITKINSSIGRTNVWINTVNARLKLVKEGVKPFQVSKSDLLRDRGCLKAVRSKLKILIKEMGKVSSVQERNLIEEKLQKLNTNLNNLENNLISNW